LRSPNQKVLQVEAFFILESGRARMRLGNCGFCMYEKTKHESTAPAKAVKRIAQSSASVNAFCVEWGGKRWPWGESNTMGGINHSNLIEFCHALL
jgi:hypothetical protein